MLRRLAPCTPCPVQLHREPSTPRVVVTFALPSLSPGVCVPHFSGPAGRFSKHGACVQKGRAHSSAAGRQLPSPGDAELCLPWGVTAQLTRARGSGPNLAKWKWKKRLIRLEPTRGMTSKRGVSLTTLPGHPLVDGPGLRHASLVSAQATWPLFIGQETTTAFT